MAKNKRQPYAEFLPDLQSVAEQDHRGVAKWIIILTALAVASLVTWAAVGTVESVASGEGVVRPVGRVKIINHNKGGRVAELDVGEGDRVKKGQILARIDPEMIDSEVLRVKGQLATTTADLIRLEAEARGQPLRFDDDFAAKRKSLVQVQRRLYASRQQGLKVARLTADQIVMRRRAQVEAIQSRLGPLQRSVRIRRRQEAAVRTLVNKEHFPRLRYLDIQRSRVTEEGRLAEAKEQLRSAKALLREAEEDRRKVDETWRSTVLQKLAEQTGIARRLEARLQQLATERSQLVIRSPVNGIVEELVVRGEGQVVQSGEPIMKIVPSGDKLIVEAKISNRDVGYITAGQKVSVKVRTFDFIKFGSMEGSVIRVSADARASKDGGPLYFTVAIRTTKDYLEIDGVKKPVRPGMLVDVDFHLGRRTILSYFTDRLVRTSETAFRER